MMQQHPWHAVSFGKQAPQIVNSIVEIPRGSRAKYEIDKETGLLKLDRILATSISYPFHYGFIPQTLGCDNDPLDILILCSEPLDPLTLVEARVLGVMDMIDHGEKDSKIISAAIGDPHLKKVFTLADLPNGTLDDIACFFNNYKRGENKKVIIEGFADAAAAHQIILESQLAYKKEFCK